jgi:hypothetical protein
MRVYFDNCIVSGEIRRDLASAFEQSAVAELRRRELAGEISILTSRESDREQERTKNPDTKRSTIAFVRQHLQGRDFTALLGTHRDAVAAGIERREAALPECRRSNIHH